MRLGALIGVALVASAKVAGAALVCVPAAYVLYRILAAPRPRGWLPGSR